MTDDNGNKIGLAEWLAAPAFAAFSRIAMLTFATFAGIIGTVIMLNVHAVLDEMTMTKKELGKLTVQVEQARAQAAAAGQEVSTMRAETNARFDKEDGITQRFESELRDDSMQVYMLNTRVGCLEKKRACPP